jgi:hypothetical protein
MTNKIIFAVRDVKADAYLPPFFMNTKGQAIRALQDSASQDPNSAFARHPQDFDLYLLGMYDDVSGKIGVDDESVYIGNLSELITA